MALLTDEEIRRIELKIEAAERLTAAEFKVIIARRAWFGFRKKAKRLFRKYKLDQTKDRNSVLLLILEKDRRILIYGDEGIHRKVGTAHWETIRDTVLDNFKQGDFAEGIALGIHLIADSLIHYFPASENQTNEISNKLIFEK